LLAKRIYELQDLVKALEVKKSNLEYSLEQVNLQKENLSKKSKDQEQEIEHLLEEIHQLRKKFTSNYP
jgi:methyl-accepting chemotaxis protein